MQRLARLHRPSGPTQCSVPGRVQGLLALEHYERPGPTVPLEGLFSVSRGLACQQGLPALNFTGFRCHHHGGQSPIASGTKLSIETCERSLMWPVVRARNTQMTSQEFCLESRQTETWVRRSTESSRRLCTVHQAQQRNWKGPLSIPWCCARLFSVVYPANHRLGEL